MEVARDWTRSAVRGEQCERAVGAQVHALEHGVTARIVAGEVIHAVLAKEQQAVEALLRHAFAGGPDTAFELFSGKMQDGHGERSSGDGPAAAPVRRAGGSAMVAFAHERDEPASARRRIVRAWRARLVPRRTAGLAQRPEGRVRAGLLLRRHGLRHQAEDLEHHLHPVEAREAGGGRRAARPPPRLRRRRRDRAGRAASASPRRC